MPDFQVKVTADTQDAQVKLRQVDEAAEKATKPRSLKFDTSALSSGLARVGDTFTNLDDKVGDAYNNIRKLYGVIEKVPGVGAPLQEFHKLIDTTKQAATGLGNTAVAMKENGGAATILGGSLRISVTAAQDLVSRLARLGMALFAVKEAAGMLQSAFGGMFQATVGREIAFRETVLKMQTTLASSQQQISQDGKVITDPYERVVAVQGAIEKRIESIRDRSLELAGVTSEQVVETFGIIVSQAGQIGVSLKQAEDLAISFAGALGTFGLPLEQARQEITSIFTGTIDPNSYLAKALNISNADIAKAKTQIGGVYGFLQEKLAAAVAGQKIAATSFAGVASNILEIAEAVQKAFGKSLLDPLLQGLTAAYELIFGLRTELANLAASVGTVLVSLLKVNFSKLFVGTADPTESIRAGIIELTNIVGRIGGAVQAAINPVLGQVRALIDAIGAAIASILPGLAALAQGFFSLQAANITALVSAFASLSPLFVQLTRLLSTMLTIYGSILQVPMVQYLSGIIVQWQVLGKTGIWAVMGLVSLGTYLIGSWAGVAKFFSTLFMSMAAGFARGAGYIATFVQQGTALFAGLINSARTLLTAFTTAFTAIATQIGLAGAALRNFGVSMQAAQAHMNTSSIAANAMAKQGTAMAGSLNAVGKSAVEASTGVGSLGGRIAGGIWSFMKANLAMLALQLAIVAVIDAWGKYDRAQKAAADNAEATSILKQYGTALFDTGEELDKATQRQRAFNKAIVEGEYEAAKQRIRDYKKEVEEFQKKNEIAKGMGPIWGGVEKSLMVPQAMNLAERMPGIRNDEALVAQVEAAQKLVDEQTDLAAEAAKTKQQLQDQLALAQSLIERNQILANTETQRQLLLGQITEDQAALTTLQEEQAANAEKLLKTQQALVDQTANGKFDTKELDKLKTEIAQLQGKDIQFRISLNKKQFDIEIKKLDAELAAQTSAISVQTNALQGRASVIQAQASAEQASNNAAMAGLRLSLERATSDSERVAIAGQMYALEVANADAARKATRAQIDASVELARLEVTKQALLFNELAVKIKIGQYYQQDVTLLQQALERQRDSLTIAQQSLSVAIEVGTANKQAADSTYSAAVRAATLNFNTAAAAKSAGQYADNMGRAADSTQRAASIMAGMQRGSTFSSAGIRGADLVDQLQLKALREELAAMKPSAAGNYADFIKKQTQLMNYIGEINRRRYAIEIEEAKQGRVDKAASLLKELREAEQSGDRDKVNLIRSKMEDVGYNYVNQARSKEQQSYFKQSVALGQYKTEYVPKSKDPANSSGTSNQPTVNITTGPVYKWQDKEFVSFADLQKAIVDAKEQLYAKLRGSPGMRQDMGLTY